MVGGQAALRKAAAAPPLTSTNRRKWQLSARPAGPVALLLHSLGIAGLTMDTDMRIWGPFGNISLASAPWHLYKSIVVEEAANGAIRELSHRRAQLAPNQGIDWALTRPLWNGMDGGPAGGPSKRHLLAFASGGHWRQHRIAAADPTISATCVLCGQDKDDDEHLWHCPALEHIRRRHSLVTGCQAALPKQLKQFGIVPHVSTDPRQAFWGGDAAALTSEQRKWLGVGVGEKLTTRHEQARMIQQGATIYSLMLYHASYEPLPECGWHRGLHLTQSEPEDLEGEPETTEPGTSSEDDDAGAPQEPTVFTDGSVRPARPNWLATAGIGAYWPKQADQLIEASYVAYWGDDQGTRAADEQGPGHLTARCVPLAARQSSTRVEAQGVLVAAAHPGAQSIALDNKGAVSRWNQLLRAIKDGSLETILRRRPWGLRPDGDLWAAAARLIRNKGPESIRVVWTKGHATEEDVKSGKSCAAHKKGNEVADLLAGAAHDL